ncbi:MAG: lipopolysaccharide heptosyltransferase II [Deltaproteobacteria bacterium]|jgi:heptosyltransferase-2|nr:lipopolysaccharide heptosyltransferase II [Deltaproteobacteria bacterium]
MNRTKLIKLKDSSRAHILIRAANWVGDAIMTTPVIRGVRRNFPKARISILAKPWVIPVYENNPYLDDIIVYQNQTRHKRGIGTLRLSKDIKSYDFDLAVLMQNAFEAALISFFAGICERLGYNTDARGLLLNRCIKLDPALKKGHLIDYYIGILKSADLENDGRQIELFITQAEKNEAKKILKENLIDPEKPVIGINPGATGGTAKRWFPEKYASLARQLSDAMGVKIVIFGGPGDEKLGQKIAEESNDSCINLAGKTSLRLAFALIENCSLFITNDSGLMHAAAALKVNQIAIIGSTDYIATAPSNSNSSILRVPVSCSPCMKPECPIDHKCMSLISVDMVFQKAMEKLHE